MVPARFELMFYLRTVAHQAACHYLSKAFLKSMKACADFVEFWRYFYTGF